MPRPRRSASQRPRASADTSWDARSLFSSANADAYERFVTYREWSADREAQRAALAGFNERVIAIEEWRLAQTQRESDRLAKLREEIHEGDRNTQHDVVADERRTVSAVRGLFTSNKIAGLQSSNALLWSVLLLLIGLILSQMFHISINAHP